MGFLSQKSVDFSEAKLFATDADGVKATTDAVDAVKELAAPKGKVTLQSVTNAFAALGGTKVRADVKVSGTDAEGKKITLAGLSKVGLTAEHAAKALTEDYGIAVDEKAVKAFLAKNKPPVAVAS